MPEATEKPPVITDTIEIKSPTFPGRPNSIYPQQHTSRLQANPEQEYVAAGYQLWGVNYLRTLSFAVDDITADFGDDLYDRMLLDSQVSACIHIFKLSVLAQGLQVLPAIDEEIKAAGTDAKQANPDFALAKEIADFVSRNLGDLQGGFDAATASTLYWSVYDLMDAFAFGNKVAEKIFTVQATGDDAGKLCLKALKTKPRRSTVFVVDVFKNVIGLLGLIPGLGYPLIVQGLIGWPETVPNILPKRKFAILSFRPKDADPRGSSMLRPAYDAWFVKQQLKQERLKFFSQLAGGAIVGYTAEGGMQQQAQNADGTLQTDVDGNPLLLNPEQAMLAALLQWANGIAAAFPFGSKVEVFRPEPLSPFDAGLDRQDREISTAIIYQTRMHMEAEHGSRADSESGQDVFGLLVRQGRAAVEGVLYDIARDLVEYNWGADFVHLTPKMSLSQTESQDIAALMTSVAALKTSEYFTPSQLPDVDAMMGLPIRTEEETQLATEMAQSAGKAAAEAAKPQPAPVVAAGQQKPGGSK